jgi:hypothetical protein
VKNLALPRPVYASGLSIFLSSRWVRPDPVYDPCLLDEYQEIHLAEQAQSFTLALKGK